MPLARLCALALVVLPIPAFAVDPQVTVIKAAHITDLRAGTQ